MGMGNQAVCRLLAPICIQLLTHLTQSVCETLSVFHFLLYTLLTSIKTYIAYWNTGVVRTTRYREGAHVSELPPESVCAFYGFRQQHNDHLVSSQRHCLETNQLQTQFTKGGW